MLDPVPGRRLDTPPAALCVLALLALLDAIFNYVWTGNGIHGSEGALLVIVSTLLMTAAAVVLLWRWATGWVARILHILLALDFVATALAADLLQAWILLVLIVLAAIAWVVHLARRRSVTVAVEA